MNPSKPVGRTDESSGIGTQIKAVAVATQAKGRYSVQVVTGLASTIYHLFLTTVLYVVDKVTFEYANLEENRLEQWNLTREGWHDVKTGAVGIVNLKAADEMAHDKPKKIEKAPKDDKKADDKKKDDVKKTDEKKPATPAEKKAPAAPAKPGEAWKGFTDAWKTAKGVYDSVGWFTRIPENIWNAFDPQNKLLRDIEKQIGSHHNKRVKDDMSLLRNRETPAVQAQVEIYKKWVAAYCNDASAYAKTSIESSANTIAGNDLAASKKEGERITKLVLEQLDRQTALKLNELTTGTQIKDLAAADGTVIPAVEWERIAGSGLHPIVGRLAIPALVTYLGCQYLGIQYSTSTMFTVGSVWVGATVLTSDLPSDALRKIQNTAKSIWRGIRGSALAICWDHVVTNLAMLRATGDKIDLATRIPGFLGLVTKVCAATYLLYSWYSGNLLSLGSLAATIGTLGPQLFWSTFKGVKNTFEGVTSGTVNTIYDTFWSSLRTSGGMGILGKAAILGGCWWYGGLSYNSNSLWGTAVILGMGLNGVGSTLNIGKNTWNTGTRAVQWLRSSIVTTS